MTDIDFDELDKAVNSLMSQRGDGSAAQETATPTAPATAPVTTPATPVAASAASVAPAASSTSAPSAPIVSTPPTEAFVAPSPAISKRPAGRFMDVVHPSSDMTNNRPVQPRPSRSGVSLQPASEPVATGTGSVAAPELTPTEPITMPATPAELAMADALDKLPISETAIVEEDITEETSVTEPAPLTAEAESTAPADTELADKIAASLQESATATPLESPFLTDAVVEKRPLGSAPEVTVPELTTADATPESAPESDETEPAPVAETETATEWNETPKGDILASELSKDIMAIESSEVATTEPAAMPAIGADIPQQYAPATDDAPEPAPMFDAASLTPEHDAAPKKKSGVLTVLLILLFALLGVAGGAAAYFFLLQ